MIKTTNFIWKCIPLMYTGLTNKLRQQLEIRVTLLLDSVPFPVIGKQEEIFYLAKVWQGKNGTSWAIRRIERNMTVLMESLK